MSSVLRSDLASNSSQVWALPCLLKGREVFALLKCEKLRHGAAPLWSFWKTDGSYTKDIFLTRAPEQAELETAVSLCNVRWVSSRPFISTSITADNLPVPKP